MLRRPDSPTFTPAAGRLYGTRRRSAVRHADDAEDDAAATQPALLGGQRRSPRRSHGADVTTRCTRASASTRRRRFHSHSRWTVKSPFERHPINALATFTRPDRRAHRDRPPHANWCCTGAWVDLRQDCDVPVYVEHGAAVPAWPGSIRFSSTTAAPIRPSSCPALPDDAHQRTECAGSPTARAPRYPNIARGYLDEQEMRAVGASRRFRRAGGVLGLTSPSSTWWGETVRVQAGAAGPRGEITPRLIVAKNSTYVRKRTRADRELRTRKMPGSKFHRRRRRAARARRTPQCRERRRLPRGRHHDRRHSARRCLRRGTIARSTAYRLRRTRSRVPRESDRPGRPALGCDRPCRILHLQLPSSYAWNG